MKIAVDFDLCRGHGECEGEAPEVFEWMMIKIEEAIRLGWLKPA